MAKMEHCDASTNHLGSSTPVFILARGGVMDEGVDGAPEVTLVFEHVRAGWMDITLGIWHERVTLPSSYLIDSPREMAAAVVRLLNGSPWAQTHFEEEGKTDRLVLIRQDRGEVRVILHHYAEGVEVRRFRRTVIDGVVSLGIFATAVLSALADVHRRLGEQHYEQRWFRPFPADAYDRLEWVLAREATRRHQECVRLWAELERVRAKYGSNSFFALLALSDYARADGAYDELRGYDPELERRK